MSNDNKRIAKNTMFLYIRMLFIMAVNLFATRVILDKLGAQDYGLYNTVAGFIGMLGFLNATLSSGTSRFLTFDLGLGDNKRLTDTFCTTFYSHLILALIMVIIMETFGLWFVYNKFTIPVGRVFATLMVYHISVFTMFVSITQVPYTSAIIAHENMGVYAYVGIFEAVAKLLVVYILVMASADRLILYASLMAAIQMIVAMSYRVYCIKSYKETALKRVFDRITFKKLLSFSGWNLFANISHLVSSQGKLVLINMFFSPALVAAQSIGNQLTNALMQFVANIRTAVNPQVIKMYAEKDYESSRKLTLQSSVYIYELLLLIGLPVIMVMEPLFKLWLVEVPPYTVIFAQYIVLREILNIYNGTLYTPMLAAAELKHNSLYAFYVILTAFILIYILFKTGFGVMWIQYIWLCETIVTGFVIKPYILCKYIDYKRSEIIANMLMLVKVSVIPLLTFVLCRYGIGTSTLWHSVASVLIIALSVILPSWIFLSKTNKKKVMTIVKSQILNRVNIIPR